MNKLNITILLCAAMIATLASCGITQKYSRPSMDTPLKYRDSVTLTADTVSLPWRAFFKDQKLNQYIELALAKNNEVATALLTMEQLDLAYKQARLSILPTLNLAVTANRSFQSKNSLNGSLSGQFVSTNYIDDYNANLQVAWEADIWGKAGLRKSGAMAEYLAQQENIAAVKTRIITQVAKAYFNLMSLDAQLKIANRNVMLSDSTLSMLTLQYNAGQVNSLAVEQVRGQLKTAQLLVPLTQKNIDVQENALSILCGKYPDNIDRNVNLDQAGLDEIFPAGIPAILLSRRPDLRAAEQTLVAANAKTGLAKAAMFPTLSLNAQSGLNAFNINNWFNIPGSIFNTLAANIAQPIFQKAELRTAYRTAQLDQQKSVVNFKQALLTAVAEVSDAMSQSRHADERLKLIREKSESLNKANNDALLLYKSGMATYLEVITAQNNSLQNDLEAATIKLEKLNAVTDLYRALGGGVN